MVNAKQYGFVNMKVKKEVKELIEYMCNKYNTNISNLLMYMITNNDTDNKMILIRLRTVRPNKRRASISYWILVLPAIGGVLFAKKYLTKNSTNILRKFYQSENLKMQMKTVEND